jgi:CubicO group peptidase (beta-lactamase class C family)
MILRAFSLLPLACCLASAHAAPSGPADRIEQGLLPAQVLQGSPMPAVALADEMRRLHVPGVSIAVLHDGKIAWAKGYGVSSPGGAAITPATLFQAASLSKPVTAVAAMRMVQDGVLTLDKPANGYLTHWKLPTEGGGDAVTVRQLLSHTAGTSVGGFPGYAPGAPVPTLLQVLDGVKPAVTEAVRVTTPPGQEWRYSGGGYTVLQQLMTDADKQPFDKLMAQRVLRPMGMGRSSFTQPASAAMLARAAMPHDGNGKPYPTGPWTHPELAAAGLWSTPSDLAAFLISLQKAVGGKTDQALTPPAARTLLTPVMNHYALGFDIAGSGTATTFAHGGHNQGYQNTMVAYTGRGDGAVVMTNGDNGDEVARALVRAVAKEYGWPSFLPVERQHVALTPAQSGALAGKYAIKGLGDFDITWDKGTLLFWLKKGQSEPLYAASPGSLFVLSQELNLTFDTPDTGRLVTGPFDVRFERVPANDTAGPPRKK